MNVSKGDLSSMASKSWFADNLRFPISTSPVLQPFNGSSPYMCMYL